jgi:hypothetical protein
MYTSMRNYFFDYFIINSIIYYYFNGGDPGGQLLNWPVASDGRVGK